MSFTGGVRRALKVLLDGFWRASAASWSDRAHAVQTAVHRYADTQVELAGRHLSSSDLPTSLAISFKLDVLGPRDQEIITMQTLMLVCVKLPVHRYALSGTTTNHHTYWWVLVIHSLDWRSQNNNSNKINLKSKVKKAEYNLLLKCVKCHVAKHWIVHPKM